MLPIIPKDKLQIYEGISLLFHAKFGRRKRRCKQWQKNNVLIIGPNAESCAPAQKVCSRCCLPSARQHLKTPPQSVVVVGHSMGGVVARALYTLPRFNPNLVSLIITQASPHLAPVLSFDPYLLGKENPDWCIDQTVELFWDE